MRAHLGTYLPNFTTAIREPHKCRMRNYVSTLAENGPAMAGPAGLVPAPMKKNADSMAVICDRDDRHTFCGYSFYGGLPCVYGP